MYRKALARLISLASEPNAKTIMKVSGVLNAAATLMSRPETSDDVQRLAGSLVTLSSNMPVTSEVSDDKSGSYGHVSIVIPRPSRVYRPDQTAMELEAGMQPSATSVGGFLEH